MGMGHHRMRLMMCWCLAFLVACVAVGQASDVAALDDTAVNDAQKASVEQLRAKLAKLEHTYQRIKGSCTANNVPVELGEAGSSTDKAKLDTVPELEGAIKAKNAAINKIADACMPGEEVLLQDTSPEVQKLQSQLKKLDKTYVRVMQSCKANHVPTKGEQKKEEKGVGNSVPTSVKALKAAIKSKNAAIDKITDACMPGETSDSLGAEEDA